MKIPETIKKFTFILFGTLGVFGLIALFTGYIIFIANKLSENNQTGFAVLYSLIYGTTLVIYIVCLAEHYEH